MIYVYCVSCDNDVVVVVLVFIGIEVFGKLREIVVGDVEFDFMFFLELIGDWFYV